LLDRKDMMLLVSLDLAERVDGLLVVVVEVITILNLMVVVLVVHIMVLP
tara:strand:+ start:426 stop:572 length:147 start_codon:yes stop_codon:yes gene_type:complete